MLGKKKEIDVLKKCFEYPNRAENPLVTPGSYLQIVLTRRPKRHSFNYYCTRIYSNPMMYGNILSK